MVSRIGGLEAAPILIFTFCAVAGAASAKINAAMMREREPAKPFMMPLPFSVLVIRTAQNSEASYLYRTRTSPVTRPILDNPFPDRTASPPDGAVHQTALPDRWRKAAPYPA